MDSLPVPSTVTLATRTSWNWAFCAAGSTTMAALASVYTEVKMKASLATALTALSLNSIRRAPPPLLGSVFIRSATSVRLMTLSSATMSEIQAPVWLPATIAPWPCRK